MPPRPIRLPPTHACVRIHHHILLQVLLQVARRDQSVRFGSSSFSFFNHLQALFQVAKATSISDFLKSCEVKNPRVVRVAGLRRGFFVPGGHAALRCFLLCARAAGPVAAAACSSATAHTPGSAC